MFVSPASSYIDSSAVTIIKNPTKPCLKRYSSVPPTTSSATSIRRQEGSCESLSSSFGSMASEDSTASRKSVVFADSVGEDLCRVKVFSKELHETALGLHRSKSAQLGAAFEESWPARMWQWQQRMAPVSEELGAGGLWFVGDETEDQEEMWYGHEEDNFEDDEEEGEDVNFGGHSVVHEVLQEENEADLVAYEEKKPVKVGIEDNTVVTPTFISPMDLPEYAEQLERLGLSLERVSVEGRRTVRGAVRAHSRLNAGFRSAPAASMSVYARISRDSWQTSERVPAVPCEAEDGLFEFDFDVSRMSVGDDVELVVETDLVKDGEKGRITDDNQGLKYRVICKSKTKFRPGKSLW